jgi:hypothetical protein
MFATDNPTLVINLRTRFILRIPRTTHLLVIHFLVCFSFLSLLAILEAKLNQHSCIRVKQNVLRRIAQDWSEEIGHDSLGLPGTFSDLIIPRGCQSGPCLEFTSQCSSSTIDRGTLHDRGGILHTCSLGAILVHSFL